MTADEARAVLEYLQASFPNQLDEPSVVVWVEELSRYDQAVALAAVRTLRVERTFLPSHAEFRSAVVAEERRAEAHAIPALGAGPADVAPPDISAERARELRASLARIGKPKPRPAPLGDTSIPRPKPDEAARVRAADLRAFECKDPTHKDCASGPVRIPGQ